MSNQPATENERAVLDVVWPWRTQSEDASGAPVSRYRPVLIDAMIALAVSVVLTHVFGKSILGMVVAGIGCFILISGFGCPILYRGFKAAGHKLGVGVSHALAWILLVPFYYTCILAGRLVLLVRRSDPMERAFKKDGSYWDSRERNAAAKDYTRQF